MSMKIFNIQPYTQVKRLQLDKSKTPNVWTTICFQWSQKIICDHIFVRNNWACILLWRALRFQFTGHSGHPNKVYAILYRDAIASWSHHASTVPNIPNNEWVQIGYTYNHLTGEARLSALRNIGRPSLTGWRRLSFFYCIDYDSKIFPTPQILQIFQLKTFALNRYRWTLLPCISIIKALVGCPPTASLKRCKKMPFFIHNFHSVFANNLDGYIIS